MALSAAQPATLSGSAGSHRSITPIVRVAVIGTFALAACREPARAWSTLPPLLHARAAHAVAATDDAIFVLAGTDAAGEPVREVERWDGQRWEVEAELPGPGLNAPAAVALAGKIFLIGGFETTTNVPSARVRVFDPGLRVWSEAAPLPAPRGGHAAVVLAGGIHVLGGGNDQRTLESHDVYDPVADAWTARAPLPRAEGSPAAVVHAGKIYVIGGRSGPSDFGAVDLYDPQADAWSEGPAIDPRGTAGAALHCGQIHVFGGESQARRAVLDEVWRLDPALGWRPLAPMPTARSFARAVVFRGAVHVVGGALAVQTSHAPAGTSVVERLDTRCQ